MSSNSIARVAVLLLLWSITGCAVFRDGKLAPIKDWPPSSTISATATGTTTKQAVNIEVSGNVMGGLKNAWTAQAVRAMKDSGLFSEVTATTRTDAPLRASVKVTYDKRMNQGMMALSGCTLYLIPVQAGHASFTVETTFYARGAIRGSIRRTEGCTVWMQLFLLFAAPFATENSIYYDCFRSTLVEAARKGWFHVSGGGG